MRRLVQDVRQRQPQRFATAVALAETQTQVDVASTKKAAETVAYSVSLTDGSDPGASPLSAKLADLELRLGALEEPPA